MSKFIFITDSSCDYSAEQALHAGFSMVPLTISFGVEDFIDGLELAPHQFFDRLRAFDGLPKTSQPSPDAFMRVFAKYEDAEHILCFCVTGESSGTVRSAGLAASMLKEKGFGPSIHVIDTRNASCTIGLFAHTAKQMADKGHSIEEILERMEAMTRTMSLYFTLDTLEYVRRGGRIGNVSAILGQALGIKPILTFFKGTPTDVAKCRGFNQAKNKLVQKFLDTAANLYEVTIVHADAPQRAKELAGELRAKVEGIRVHIHSAGAVIGTYAGPGAVGLAFEEKKPRWA